jgi:DnaJ-class molecular chaperone
MVNVLNAADPNCSTYGQILEDVQAVLHTFQSWKVCHTKRGENSMVHWLAKEIEGLNMTQIEFG